MVAEFNTPPETFLENPHAEFASPADQPPQVINEDSPIINVGGDGDANEDDYLVQIDNLAGVLSSKDRPPTL